MNAWPAALVVLAQAAGGRKPPDAGEATVWLFVLTAIVIVAFMVAGVVIYVVRSRALREETTATDVPLTLHDLRQMREQGEIDADELERLKAIVTAQAKKDRPRPPSEDLSRT